MIFPFKRKGFQHKFCVLECDCYFGLIVFFFFFDNIIWDSTSGIRTRLEWKRWPKKKEKVQELRNLMEQTSRIGGYRLKIISKEIASASFGDET